MQNFRHDIEKLGLGVLICFEQPIDAIRLYLKDVKLNLRLIGGEEGFPIIIPSANLIKSVMSIP